ncbi:type II toxin-antitoxin system RelE/ParE family toxin [Providencia rustigianii]|uniref:type II toxin-antitoxin system RelE/ParE family toxin n=1 Tax=Providencia rustigianii TaxID=158850 RepID=UPI0022445D2A|nr:type II toxin-antitoxin system RelE/ParE family toxin [Providencia rustigianii]
MRIIRHYLTTDGKDPCSNFIDKVKDPIARTKVVLRINQLAKENLGKHKYCRNGVWELKIDQGPGYRIYYSLVRDEIILLLLAGTKKTQQADIGIAIQYLTDYLR